MISAFVARQSPQNQSLNRSNPLNGKHSQDSPLQLLPGLPCEECSILAGEKEYDTIDTTELGDGETASADIEDGSNSLYIFYFVDFIRMFSNENAVFGHVPSLQRLPQIHQRSYCLPLKQAKLMFRSFKMVHSALL